MCQALGTKQRCLLVGAAGSMEKIDTKQMPSITQSPVGHPHRGARAHGHSSECDRDSGLGSDGLWETSLHAPGAQGPFVHTSPCPWPLPF